MPIQRIEGAPVQRAPYPGAYVSPEAASAPARALGSVARGLSDIGGVAEGVALKEASLKNDADELKVRQILRAHQTEFQSWLGENPDETKWGEEFERQSTAASEEIAKLNLAPIVRQSANLTVNDWQQEQRSSVNTQARVAARRRADAVFVAEADYAAKNGELPRAYEMIDKRVAHGGIHPDVAPILKREAKDKSDRAAVAGQMAAAEMLPLRDQVASLRDLRAEVLATEDISDQVQTESVSVLTQHIESAQREMDRNALTLISDVRQGRATYADASRAVEQGLVDLGFFGPDQVDPRLQQASIEAGQDRAEQQRIAQDRVRAAKERSQTALRASLARFEALEKDALSDFTAGPYDIDVAVERGEIDQVRGQALKARLEAITVAQQTRPPEDGVITYGDINDQLDAAFALNALGQPEEKSQPNEGFYRDMLVQINDPKAALTVPNRLALLEKLYMAKLADLQEGETDVDGTIFDRDVTANEFSLRQRLYSTYRQILPSLGPRNAGALMLAQEPEIVDFFDRRDKPPAPAELDAFLEKLTTAAKAGAVDELLRASFGY